MTKQVITYVSAEFQPIQNITLLHNILIVKSDLKGHSPDYNYDYRRNIEFFSWWAPFKCCVKGDILLVIVGDIPPLAIVSRSNSTQRTDIYIYIYIYIFDHLQKNVVLKQYLAWLLLLVNYYETKTAILWQ